MTPPCVAVGFGPAFGMFLTSVAVEADRTVLASDPFQGLLRVDPATGDRTVFALAAGELAVAENGDFFVLCASTR